MTGLPSRKRSVSFISQMQGSIDRETWRRGALLLAAILAPLTLIWFLLSAVYGT